MTSTAGPAGAFVIEWKNLERWIALEAPPESASLARGWRVVRLGEVARSLEIAEKIDPTQNYALAGVRLDGGGIYHRETVSGAQTSAAYLSRLRPGALIYGRLFAWRGAFGVVRAEHAELWCSNEFPQFEIDTAQADADYLCLWSLSARALAEIEKRSIGTAAVSRNRLKEKEYLALQLPMPPLALQREIIAAWRKAQDEATAARARADAIEAKARAAFLAGLGLREPPAAAARKAFAVEFTCLDRWGVAQVRESLVAPDLAAGKYPVVRLGDVIANLENGWSPKCHPRPARADEWGVLKLGAVSFGTYDETENKALPSNLKPIAALEIKAGDTLISRANVPRYVGACAYVEATRPNLMLCDKIFRVVPHKGSQLELRYLADIMKSPHLRRQIENSTTGASPTMQNISKPSLLALRLPLPPLVIQRQLIEAMATARTEAVRLRTEADQQEAHAATVLESALLGSPTST